MIIIELKFKSVIKRWPAIKLAVRRIESDNGRIKILIVSISVINGAKQIGVLIGIKWAIIFFVFLQVEKMILNNQNGNARVIENTIWLEEEKI